jgi:hypothetical protein
MDADEGLDEYDKFQNHMEETFPLMFAEPYGGFAVGEGWYRIVEDLCYLIQNHIDGVKSRRKFLLEKNPDYEHIPEEVPQVVVRQIKEKFGGFRFYYDGGDDYIMGLVTMAEQWCARTCEECGAPGKHRGGGWIRTLCDRHEIERQERMKASV